MWLQGDNMRESCDSRTYGQVHKNNVYGKVVCQIYPQFKFLNNTLEYAGQEELYQNIVKMKSDDENTLVSPVE